MTRRSKPRGPAPDGADPAGRAGSVEPPRWPSRDHYRSDIARDLCYGAYLDVDAYDAWVDAGRPDLPVVESS